MFTTQAEQSVLLKMVWHFIFVQKWTIKKFDAIFIYALDHRVHDHVVRLCLFHEPRDHDDRASNSKLETEL